MHPRIVYVNSAFDNGEAVEELAPPGFDLVRAEAGSPAYQAALGEASYLVGFIDGLVEDGLYRAAPRLKLIQLLSAGYDRADIAAARRAGVPIANNGGANAVAVAEHALMLMLAVCRRLPLQHANVGAGRWRGNETPRVHELRGRTLGIVGLGTIGKKAARLAGAFGMTVQYYDIARLTEDAEDALGVRFRLLGELLRSSDIVSLHVPLNPTTRHGARDALLKPGAVLINTSRAGGRRGRADRGAGSGKYRRRRARRLRPGTAGRGQSALRPRQRGVDRAPRRPHRGEQHGTRAMPSTTSSAWSGARRLSGSSRRLRTRTVRVQPEGRPGVAPG